MLEKGENINKGGFQSLHYKDLMKRTFLHFILISSSTYNIIGLNLQNQASKIF